MNKILLFTFFLFNTIFAEANNQSYHFERIFLSENSAGQFINCITQDRFGFMWFGSKNGLYRYDGKRINAFYSDPGDSTSLPGNEIQLLFLDSRGILWVSANGLARYNQEQENFTNIVAIDKPEITKNLRYISEICEDNLGNLWLGTFGKGLYRYSPISGDLIFYDLENTGPGDFGLNIIYSISKDKQGNIWIGSVNRKITCINPANLTKRQYFFNRKKDFQNFFIDHLGKMWLGGMT